MPIHPLLSFALVLTAGLIGGELVARLKLPRVTGWIITGVVLQSLNLPGLSGEVLGRFLPFTDFVLGYIAFTVGSHLNFRQLRNAGKRLLLLMLAEATITPLIVMFAMSQLGGFSLDVAFVFAAIAVAGAPGTTVLVVREARASGVFVRTLVAAVALIDMVAVCLFVVVEATLSSSPLENSSLVFTTLSSVGKAIALAGGIAIVIAGFVIVLTRVVVGAKLLGASFIAAIVLTWGLADFFGASPILSCTFVGMALGNLIRDSEHAGEAYLNTFSDILFTVFYTLAGLRLEFSSVLPMAGLVGIFLASRAFGKSLSAYLSMSLAGALGSVRKYLGIALLPHGGVAVGLMFFVQKSPALSDHAETILVVGLAALAINQFIGPSATRFALSRVGEAGKDRPRLLDFLREQDIITNFRASSKENAIRQLVNALYRTHHVQTDKAEFLEKVFLRDAEESTSLGEGVMIPHGVLGPEDSKMVGVMALSSRGLDFETPDGLPVHAIVLLATPPTARSRHLEVLAAFAKAIAGNRDIRDQLYSARTPAHAYHLLHHGNSLNFNYFLEDTMTSRAVSSHGSAKDKLREG